MYSPKIEERFVPILYKHAKVRKVPMTRLVTEAIELYLKQVGSEPISPEDGWVVTDHGRESVHQPQAA